MTDKPATPGAQEQSAFTMLCWRNDVEEAARLLAANPAAVHWRHNKTGDTGLTHAAALGIEDCRMAALLLDAGADINVKNDAGMTALMLAVIARNGSEAHVALLLDRGADQAILNAEGKTAEEIARSIGRPAVAAEFDKFRFRKEQARKAQVETLRHGTQAPVTVRKKPIKFKS